MEDYAVVGGILALALLSYLAVLTGDKWTRVHSDTIVYGVVNNIQVPLKQRQMLFFNSYIPWVAGSTALNLIIVLAFLGIARSVTQPFAQMLAYVCAVMFMLGVAGNLGQGALWGHYLWSSLSKERRDQVASARH
jgi:hypothetical protein